MMKVFKISIEYSTEIEAKNEDEALELFDEEINNIGGYDSL